MQGTRAMSKLPANVPANLPANLKAGPVVDRICYTSEEIFAEETRRIFGRAWLFVAHESELRKTGDFITTDLAGQPVLAVRGDDGAIRVLFNTCRHRGAIIEDDRQGCRQSFRCLYHHWIYDTRGRLAVVPRAEGFGPQFDAAEFGLVPVPRVEVFHGLVFASLDRDVPGLVDYLGTAAPYLQEVASYDGRGQEALGSFEFTYEGNWKLLYENSLDDYHAEYLHSAVYQSTPGFKYGHDYMRQKIVDGAAEPEEAEEDKAAGSRSCTKLGIHGVLEWHDPVEKLRFQKERTHRINIAIFPAFLGVFHPVLDATGLRIIKPEGVARTRVLNYCLAPVGLSEAAKKAAAERFHTAWGPGGRIMMDDIRALNQVQRGMRAASGGDIMITRGLHRPGPRGTVADEHTIRGFWDAWRHFMLDEAALSQSRGA
jgi:p-cumate 2,3-dioxygenase alpha subunit